jgi:phage-related protein
LVRIRDLMVEEGPDLGMPYTRAMGKGLFEIRCRSHEGFGRVFFGIRPGRTIVMLHAFLKKTPKTPPRELAVAYRRLREVTGGEV